MYAGSLIGSFGTCRVPNWHALWFEFRFGVVACGFYGIHGL